MSMRLTDICAAIAAELVTAGLPAVYPSPPAASIVPPLVVIFSGPGRRERSMGEQYYHHTIKARVYATTIEVPTRLAWIDDKVEELGDHFDADNADAFHLRNYAAGKSVDFCELVEWQLSGEIAAGGNTFLGGDLLFHVKVRRQRNDP